MKGLAERSAETGALAFRRRLSGFLGVSVVQKAQNACTDETGQAAEQPGNDLRAEEAIREEQPVELVVEADRDTPIQVEVALMDHGFAPGDFPSTEPKDRQCDGDPETD